MAGPGPGPCVLPREPVQASVASSLNQAVTENEAHPASTNIVDPGGTRNGSGPGWQGYTAGAGRALRDVPPNPPTESHRCGLDMQPGCGTPTQAGSRSHESHGRKAGCAGPPSARQVHLARRSGSFLTWSVHRDLSRCSGALSVQSVGNTCLQKTQRSPRAGRGRRAEGEVGCEAAPWPPLINLRERSAECSSRLHTAR